MSVREIEFVVTADGISPAVEQDVGMQGEHAATLLKFCIANNLYEKLLEECGQGESLIYRFDCCDSMGNTIPYDTVPLTDSVVAFPIEENLSRNGGKAKVYFIVTRYNKNDKTELELISRPAKLRFENVPEKGDNNGSSLESLSTLAQSSKNAAEIALRSAEDAIEAQKQTELSKFEMESGTTVIFKGGNASSRFNIDLKIDDMPSKFSNNPLSNKKITEEFENIKEIINAITLANHPIGSLYWSSDPTDPSEIFGGTWEQIKGRFLLAAGENEANTTEDFGRMSAGELNRPVGELGGEATHTLTVDQMPSHSHNSSISAEGGTKYGLASGGGWEGSVLVSWGAEERADTVRFTGGNQPHNNMPPYITKYCWERIA